MTELNQAALDAANEGMEILALGLEQGGRDAALPVAWTLALLQLWRDLVDAGAEWPEAVAAAKPSDWNGPFITGWDRGEALASPEAAELLDQVLDDSERWRDRCGAAWRLLGELGAEPDGKEASGRWLSMGVWVSLMFCVSDVWAENADAGLSLLQAVEWTTDAEGHPHAVSLRAERIESLPDGAGFAVLRSMGVR